MITLFKRHAFNKVLAKHIHQRYRLFVHFCLVCVLILTSLSHLELRWTNAFTDPSPIIRSSFRQIQTVHKAQSFIWRRTHWNISTILSTKNTEQQQPEELLNIAAKLREEVRELEAAAESSRQSKTSPSTASSNTVAVEYTDLANSIWTLSYRFANDPEQLTSIDDPDKLPIRRLFGGKATIKFRQDGYTDLISQQSFGVSTERCTLIKTWGWDVELSKDNEKDTSNTEIEYVLFSIDVELPANEEKAKKERFYFQARKDVDIRTGVISLVDGTVTVKRDVVQKSSRWGLFSPAGILAQFRYVGNFIAKPERIE